MRIIGEIEHPRLKISVFQMGEKLSIKFETNLLEQIYKFRDGSGIYNLVTATKWVNEELLSTIESQFDIMAKTRHVALEKMHQEEGEEWPIII